MTQLTHAQLEWDAQGQPVSSEFADVYFSRLSGLDESRYVFIQHNQLTQRFQSLNSAQPFVVAETGFGTGLNFLACWQHFLEHAPAHASLHFISVEKFPLSAPDLKQALALWPELRVLSEQLEQQYLGIQPGYQHFVFDQGRIRLTLLIGEASTEFAQLNAQVDAWFLDGFAPAKNPQMWTDALFYQLARLSKPEATLATFTSAGFVRRGLQAVGFAMQRVPGFGHKREMLSGNFISAHAHEPEFPWFKRPSRPFSSKQKAIVIGAGISGCATAFSLAQRGWKVTLIERNNEIAQEASGNPQGILYIKPSAHNTALSQLLLSGFGYTRRLLTHWPDSPYFDACGLLQLAFDGKELERQQQLARHFDSSLLRALSSQEASDLAGVDITTPALFYPESGWIRPSELCKALIQHANIELLCGHEAKQLVYARDEWEAHSENERIASAPVVVIAAANQVSSFSQSNWLPLKPIRGQVTSIPATETSRKLKPVISAKGYIAPAFEAQHCLGASFNFQRTDTQIDTAEHAENLQHLNALSPELAEFTALPPEQLSGHAALRCTSPDYLPILGPLVNYESMLSAYAGLRTGAKAQALPDCPWLPGLYVNTAHGSRGMITAPLSGEVLAAWICEEALPLPQSLLDACHPNRFVIRGLKRKSL